MWGLFNERPELAGNSAVRTDAVYLWCKEFRIGSEILRNQGPFSLEELSGVLGTEISLCTYCVPRRYEHGYPHRLRRAAVLSDELQNVDELNLRARFFHVEG